VVIKPEKHGGGSAPQPLLAVSRDLNWRDWFDDVNDQSLAFDRSRGEKVWV
jgi:hypothetical protein